MLDLSGRVAGAYCTKLLADAGAEVVKVEPSTGDPLRHWSPVRGPLPAGEESTLFEYLCASKRSVRADLDEVADRRRLEELVRESDLIVDTAGPGQLDRLGLGFEVLERRRPGLVQVSITDFGLDGPWARRAATEFTLQAWCGSIGFRGFPERPPLAVGGQVGEYLGGVVAAVAGLAALRRARTTGRGEHADVSLLECMTAGLQGFEWLHVSLMALTGLSRSVEVPSIEQAKDGWVGFTMVTAQQWDDFATMVEQPILAEDPELRLQLGRWPRRQEVYEAIGPWLRARTVAEIVELASLYRIPVAALGNGSTVTGEEHFTDRAVFVGNPGGGFRQPGPPWRMAGVEPRQPTAAPRLDQHTDRPFAEESEGRQGKESPSVSDVTSRRLPLEGIRIVDFTAFWAGPAATHVLAALGADVVKVESVQRPDGMRFAGGQRPGIEEWWEWSWIFHGVNVGKRAITLDLASTEGLELVRRLTAGADVVIENFSPRVMEAFGLDWPALQRVNPRLLMVRMPAFGLEGPWRDRVGFAPTMEQISGMAWVTGYPDGPPTAPRGACDPLAGYHAVFVLLAALRWRERSGTGQLIEMPMIEVALNVTAGQVAEYERTGRLAGRQGNRGPEAAPQNVYACSGDEQWLALAVADDEQWLALRQVLGDPPWARDPALALDQGRRAAHDRIDEKLGAWFKERPLEETVDALAAAGVPAAPVVLPPDVVANPQLLARGFFEKLLHPVAGEQLYARPPLRLSGGPEWWYWRPPPLLGQHNDEVLGTELGLQPGELAGLRRAGVIGDRPAGL